MRYLFFFSILIFSAGMCYGQDRISYNEQLLHAKTDTAKLSIYINAIRDLKLNKTDSAFYYLKRGYAEFSASHYKKGQGAILLMEAEIQGNGSMLHTAETNLREALSIFRELKDTIYLVKALKSLGIIEGRQGKYAIATSFFIESLKIQKFQNDRSGIIDAYIKLGVVNELNKNLTHAMNYYNLALSLCQVNDSLKKANIYNNIGTAYCRQRQYSKGIPYFLRSLDYGGNSIPEDFKIMLYNNLGEAYHNLQNRKKALTYYNLGLSICEQYNFPEDKIRLLLNKAGLTAETHPQLALQQLYAILQTADSLQLPTMREEILNALVDVNKQTGNYKDALMYKEQLTEVRDSLYTITKSEDMANLQSGYALEQSKEKVTMLQAQQIERQQKNRVVVIIAISLAVALAFLIYSYNNIQYLNKNLIAHETELQRLNDVKDKLFSIIGHDLRGYIGTMPMLIALLDDESTDADEKAYIINALQTNATASLDTLDTLLTWGRAQIKGITIDPSEFKVKELIHTIMNQQQVNINQKHITISERVGDDVQVMADKNHFMFVMRNLLSNAIKYSHKNGVIEISADNTTNPQEVIFSIRDHGVGMNKEKQTQIFNTGNTSTKGTANEIGSSIALVLCSDFIEKNGGRIWVESEESSGSIFYFILKKASRGILSDKAAISSPSPSGSLA